MPRVARIVVPGLPHHVVQRGNNRQDVFFTLDDRHLYLQLLLEETRRSEVPVDGYCLMSNHVHLIVTPADDDGLGRAVGRTHFRYAQQINRLHGRSGHLWQGRYFSCPMDARHLVSAMQYVERNPVRARMVRAAWRYPWSSAAAHCGEPDATGLLDLASWRRRKPPAVWREDLRRPGDESMVARLCSGTRTGRPLGTDAFLSKLESALGRRLRPLPVGRPRKRKERTGGGRK